MAGNEQIGIDVVLNVDDSQLTAAIQRTDSMGGASSAGGSDISVDATGNPLQGITDGAAEAANAVDSLRHSVQELDKESDNNAADGVEAVGDAAEAAAGNVSHLGAAAQEAARNEAQLSQSTEQAGVSLTGAGDAASAAGEHFHDMGQAADDSAERLEQVSENANTAQSSFTDLINAVNEVKDDGAKLTSVASSMLSFGASAVEAAGDFEQLKAKLVTVQHSTETAAETFEYAKQLAASTPFDVKGVVDAAVQLEVYGQSSKELLPVVANLAAAMGGDVSVAATAMGRALTGSSEGLQSLRDSFGITYANLEKFGAVLNKQGSVALDSADNISKFKEAITQLVNTQFAGGIERQAATVAGALGNLEDEMTNAKAAIGDQLSPYVTILSEQAANVVSVLGQIPPFGVMIGVATTAIIGLSGAFVTACASAVAFKSACDRLKVSLAGVGAQAKSLLQLSNASFAAIATRMSLVTAGATIVGEAGYAYLQAWIAEEQKQQQAISDSAKAVVEQRKSWDDLRTAIEKAAAAKAKFSYKDATPGAEDVSKLADNITGVQLIDALSTSGIDGDILKESIAQYEANIQHVADELSKTQTQLKEARANLAQAQQAPKPQQRPYADYGQANIELNTLKANVQDLERQEHYLNETIKVRADMMSQISKVYEKLTTQSKRIAAAEKAATADAEYGKYAMQIKDLDALRDAYERTRKSLAGLNEVAKGQTALSDADLKNPGARTKHMGKLLREGKQDSAEYALLQQIQEQEENLTKIQDSYFTMRGDIMWDKKDAADKKYEREQAGREKDLAAERKHVAEMLDLEKKYRQYQANIIRNSMASRANGILPSEKKDLERQLQDLNHLSDAEVKGKNQLFALDKQIALKSLTSDVETLGTAANNLAAQVTANADDVVSAYDKVVKKIEEWAQANQGLISKSPEVKQAYTKSLAQAVANRQQAVDNRGNKALQALQDKAAERQTNANGPVKQLDAVQENIRMLQQALRVNKDIKASDAARVLLQKQIVALGKQELTIKEKINELQKQMASENSSLEIQLKEDELTDLEARADAGENVKQAVLAKEQEIHQMKLAMISEEKEAQLEAVNGKAELETEVLKKYAILRQLEDNRYNRQLKQHTTKAKANLSGQNFAIGEPSANLDSETVKPATDQYKPGSPLMTLQEALNSANQWYADQVNSTEFEDRIAKEEAADHADYLKFMSSIGKPNTSTDAATDKLSVSSTKAASSIDSLATATDKLNGSFTSGFDPNSNKLGSETLDKAKSTANSKQPDDKVERLSNLASAPANVDKLGTSSAKAASSLDTLAASADKLKDGLSSGGDSKSAKADSEASSKKKAKASSDATPKAKATAGAKEETSKTTGLGKSIKATISDADASKTASTKTENSLKSYATDMAKKGAKSSSGHWNIQYSTPQTELGSGTVGWTATDYNTRAALRRNALTATRYSENAGTITKAAAGQTESAKLNQDDGKVEAISNALNQVDSLGTSSDSASAGVDALASAATTGAAEIKAAMAGISASASAGANPSQAVTAASLPTTSGAGAASAPGDNAPVTTNTVTNNSQVTSNTVNVNGVPQANNSVDTTAIMNGAAHMLGAKIASQLNVTACI